jgi:glycosyltransferase involved in cell wall biosynthesis
VEAFALVRRERPDARLVLSAPADRGKLAAAGVPDRAPGVEWHDLDDRAALARAYGEAWAGVLPSSSEAFGLVLAESLACGTPVVGHADGAIPEVISDARIGRLFAALTAEALAGALLETLELTADPETAGHCRARAAEFSTERFVAAYLELYRELGVG